MNFLLTIGRKQSPWLYLFSIEAPTPFHLQAHVPKLTCEPEGTFGAWLHFIGEFIGSDLIITWKN